MVFESWNGVSGVPGLGVPIRYRASFRPRSVSESSIRQPLQKHHLNWIHDEWTDQEHVQQILSKQIDLPRIPNPQPESKGSVSNSRRSSNNSNAGDKKKKSSSSSIGSAKDKSFYSKHKPLNASLSNAPIPRVKKQSKIHAQLVKKHSWHPGLNPPAPLHPLPLHPAHPIPVSYMTNWNLLEFTPPPYNPHIYLNQHQQQHPPGFYVIPGASSNPATQMPPPPPPLFDRHRVHGVEASYTSLDDYSYVYDTQFSPAEVIKENSKVEENIYEEIGKQSKSSDSSSSSSSSSSSDDESDDELNKSSSAIHHRHRNFSSETLDIQPEKHRRKLTSRKSLIHEVCHEYECDSGFNSGAFDHNNSTSSSKLTNPLSKKSSSSSTSSSAISMKTSTTLSTSPMTTTSSTINSNHPKSKVKKSSDVNTFQYLSHQARKYSDVLSKKYFSRLNYNSHHHHNNNEGNSEGANRSAKGKNQIVT